MADVRRVERAAEQADHVTEHQRLVADLDLAALPRAGGAERGLELLGRRRRCRHAEAPVGAEDPVGRRRAAAAGRRGTRRAPPGSGCGAAPPAGRARTAPPEAPRLPAPVAARDGEDARRSGRPRRRARGGSGSRSTLFSTTTCGRSSRPGAVLGELVVDLRGTARPGRPAAASITWTSSARALEVREELVAEPDALARALDQARDVRDRQLPPVGRVDRAEHRLERRERVVGDLRLRVRDPAQQRRLAGVRQPDERRVGDAASAAARARPPRRAARSRRSAASGASGSRSGGCRARRAPPRATTMRAPGAARSATSLPSASRPASRPGRAARCRAPSAPCLPLPRPVLAAAGLEDAASSGSRRGRGGRGRRRARRRPRARRRRRRARPSARTSRGGS